MANRKWYVASYGFSEVIGQEWANLPGMGKILRFRWGTPFRFKHFVEKDAVICECPDPRWFGWLFRLFER